MWETILKLLVPFFPTEDQKQKADQAAADAQIRFYGVSPLYAILVFLEVLGALWDAFFNAGRAWAETSRNLAQSPFGVVEIVVILFPFFGFSKDLVSIAMQALRAGLAASGSATKVTVVPPAPVPPATGQPHERGREE